MQQWQGLSEVVESQNTSQHSTGICPVKQPRSNGDSQTTYIPTNFFSINILRIAGLEPMGKRYVASCGENHPNYLAIPDATWFYYYSVDIQTSIKT